MRIQDPPCPWDERVCDRVAHHGDLEALQWLRAQDPPCPWNENRIMAGANHHLDVMQWVHSTGVGWGDYPYICYSAAQFSRLDILQWLRAQDPPCPWGALGVRTARRFNRPDPVVIQWLRDNGCPDEPTCW